MAIQNRSHNQASVPPAAHVSAPSPLPGRRNTILKRAGLFTLSFAMMFLLGEFLIRQLVILGRPSQSASVVLDHKFNLARKAYSKTTPSILMIGDSFMNMSLYPELMTMRLAERGWRFDIRNLGNPGNNTNMSLFLLKQAVESGAKPNVVLYNLNPASFNGQRHWDSEEKLRQSYIGHCFYEPPVDFGQRLDCSLQKSSYLFRYRGFLKTFVSNSFTAATHIDRDLLQNPWGGKPRVYLDSSPAGWSPGYRIYSQLSASKRAKETQQENEAENQAQPAETEKTIRNVLSLERKRFADNHPNDAVWDDAPFRTLQRYCRERKLPLVLVWLPSAYDRPQNYTQQSQHYADQFKALADGKTTWFVNLHEQPMKPSFYYDNGHLNILGALPITEAVSQRLMAPSLAHLLGEKHHSSPANDSLKPQSNVKRHTKTEASIE